MRFSTFVGVAAFCLTPLFPAQAQTMTPNTIMVTGIGTLMAAPDFALVTLTLAATDKSPAAALAAHKDMQARIAAALRPFAITDGQIQESNFSVTTGRPPAVVLPGSPIVVPPATGNSMVSSRVIITVNDLSKLPAVIDSLAQLGSNISVARQLDAKNRSALEDKARAAALADARHQAEMLAAADGVKLDKAIALSTSMAPGNYLNLLTLNPLLGAGQEGEISVSQQVVVEFGIQ